MRNVWIICSKELRSYSFADRLPAARPLFASFFRVLLLDSWAIS